MIAKTPNTTAKTIITGENIMARKTKNSLKTTINKSSAINSSKVVLLACLITN
jgi:hypothetical protein